jgi:hypothetical protein
MTGYGLEVRGSIPDKGEGIFSIPQRPDRPSGALGLVSNGH